MKDKTTVARVAYLLVALGLVITSAILALLRFQDQAYEYVPLALSLIVASITLFVIIIAKLLQGKVMKPWITVPANVWAGVLVAIAIVGMAFTVPSLHKQYFMSTAPYLTWTGGQDPSTSITVCWVSTFPKSESMVRYGTSPSSLIQSATTSSGNKHHHVALSGLVPDTTYYYSADGSPVKQFTTAPAGEFNFTFYVWSDPRQNNDFYTALGRPNTPLHMAQHAATVGDDVAFSICTGDITSTAFDYDTWNLWFQDIATHDWAVNKSHVVAFGNHERHGNPQGDAIELFYPHEKRPDGRFWYAFNYSNALFIMLDTYLQHASWMSNFTSEHLAWLEDTLEASKDMPFKFAFMHPPARNGAGVQADLERLAGEYNIQLFMTGHSHRYNRTIVNDTNYVIQGIGGNANNVFRNLDVNTAFTIIRVAGATATVEVTWINGTVHDSFTLSAA